MSLDRKDRKPLRAFILARTDAELTYCREEIAREENRRRLATRRRRAAKRVSTKSIAD